MSEFDERLNQLLSNPSAMDQILSLANSLSGGEQAEAAESPPQPSAAAKPSNGGDLSSLLTGLDPAMLGKLTALLQAYRQGDSEKAALLNALRPFLKAERAGRIDKAIRMAKLSHLLRLGLELFRKEGDGLV